jgi:lactate permease
MTLCLISPFTFTLVILVPVLLIFKITETVAGFRGIWLTTLLAGLSFGLSQFWVAKYIGPELPAIIGSAISFGAIVLCARISPPAKEWRFPHEETTRVACEKARSAGTIPEQIIAWMPYLLLLLLVLGTSKLWPQSNELFSNCKSAVSVYDAAGGKPLYIDWILTPGTLIMVSAIMGGLIQGISPRNLTATFVETLLSLRKTAVTVISIVSMAKVLSYSGMVGSIATALAESTGSCYPVFAPLIGALGTFVTGSDTSANVLFGALQRDVALQIGADPSWIAAANTSGACAGKLISPQSIAIAVAATGLSGREGDLLGITIKYVCIFITLLGIITYALA